MRLITVRRLLCAMAILAISAVCVPVAASVNFVTCIGGASGMTTQLNPFATEGVVRGCAPQVMDVVLKYRDGTGTGTVKYAYSAARMQAYDELGNPDPQWSEPKKDDPNWKPGQVKFTGDMSACEVSYLRDSYGNLHYSLVLRSDSVIGIRWAVNRQKIYDFVTLKSGYPVWVDDAKQSISDPDWTEVLADINARLASGGIPIEGGLAECYIDSAVRSIDKFNRLFPAPEGGIVQPQCNPANFLTTKDNLLAIAVLAVIYNRYIQETWNGDQPVVFGIPELKMITGGKIDSWDCFFSNINEPNPDRKRLLNYYREPLSGTCNTYLFEVMRGVEKEPNGSVMDEYFDMATETWQSVAVAPGDTNWHRSGIPGLTCQPNPTSSAAPNAKPGSGAVNTAVNLNYGGIGYTFLQKFTMPGQSTSGYANIRVAMVNGVSPYPFDNGNSFPGVNGTREVTDPEPGKSFYQNVVDGKYPLWTYNHVFDGTNGASQGLNDFVARFTQTANAPVVRSVGLLPLSDMDTFASHRSVPTSGPNAGRGPGFGRCGFVSAITGETVRDGMAIMLKDPSTPDGLPGESYPDNRP